MKMKQIIPIYMILNGLSTMVPTMLGIGFSITLFEKDNSGISGAYLETATLLGIGFAGLIGGFFFKRFSSYAIGIGTLLCAASTLLIFSICNGVHLQSSTIALWALACIMSIEHANGLAFINTQIGVHNKPFFFSTYQLFLQFFNVLAPIVAKNLLAIIGLKILLLLCSLIYILRIIPWQLFRGLSVQEMARQPLDMLTGLKEIIQNPGLLRITSFRLASCIAISAYTVSLPILVARMANSNSQTNAQLHSYSVSIMHLAFVISGIYGSWILKRRSKWILYFFKISPVFIVLSSIIAFYVRQPFYLHAAALLYGMGLYLIRTAIATIGQALTKSDKLAYVILAGDGVVKSFAWGIGSFILYCIALPPVWGIAPPFVGVVLSSLLSLGMIKPITKIYLASLYKKNSRK